MRTLKEQYYGTANNLMERLMDEAPEDVEAGPDVMTGGEPVEPEAPENTEIEQPEEGQAEQVEIFFDNLDEKTQKILMDAFKEAVNATEEDEYAEQKILDALKSKPLITFRAEELVRKLNIDV